MSPTWRFLRTELGSDAVGAGPGGLGLPTIWKDLHQEAASKGSEKSTMLERGDRNPQYDQVRRIHDAKM